MPQTGKWQPRPSQRPLRGPRAWAAWALVAGALACAKPQPQPGAAFGHSAPRHGPDELWLGLGGEPSTLDPARCNESVCGLVIGNLFAGLVTFATEALDIEGDLAASWSLSADGCRYRFRLRPSRWSDGTPISANDIVCSTRRVLRASTAAPSAHLLYVIAGAQAYHQGQASADEVGVVALAPDVVEFRLRHPTPWFLQLLTHSVLRPIPAHVAAQQGEPAQWPVAEALVTSGAYRVQRWRFRRDADFVRNEGYFRAPNVTSRHILARIIPNADAAMALYEYGSLDVLGTHVPMAWQPRVVSTPDYRQFRLLSSNYYWLNTRRPPLDDVRVRRALSLAIDRQALVTGVLRGQSEAAHTLVPPALLPAPPGPAFDPALARQLLAQASREGHAPKRPLVLSYNADEVHRRLAEAIQAMWHETLGIEVELRQQEWRVYLRDLESHDFDVARLGWIADYADGRSFLADVFGGDEQNNLSGWHDAPFLSWLEQSDLQADGAQRRELLARAQRRMLEAQPMIPLSFGNEVTLIKPYVRGFVANPLGHTQWHRLAIGSS